MEIKIKLFLVFILISCSSILSKEQEELTGGKYISSRGNLNALFLFIHFPDDRYMSKNIRWELNNPPDYIDKFIDKKNSSVSHNGFLSCYFDDMSKGVFRLTGKTMFLITPHTRSWYIENKKTRADINREIIEKADSSIDFDEFDNWHRLNDYLHLNEPDSVIDMIFVIYRNIANELPDSIKKDVEAKLGLTPGGEASLGYGKSFKVDNGKYTINMSYPGSGITVKIAHDGLPVSGCAHELAHYITGGSEMHFNKGMWGLLSTWGYTQRSFMMNSWERWKAGWLKLKVIGPESGEYNVELNDYVESCEAVRINSSKSNEYFLLENHQRINSFWDIPDQSTPDTKGIYVMRQAGTNGNSVSLICADGRWKWEVVEMVKNPYGGEDSLPVFRKVEEDKINGYMDNELIPYRWNGKQKSEAISFYKDNKSGKVIEKPVFRGDGGDFFDLERNEFSAETNPNSQTSVKKPSGISFRIISKNKTNASGEIYKINIKIE
jgi:M6 family metalloprotease-like protein